MCSALNPASRLPTEGEPLKHACEEVLAECYSAGPDLLDQPPLDPDLTPRMAQGRLWSPSLRPSGLTLCLLPPS
jgi:hypothetical protein